MRFASLTFVMAVVAALAGCSDDVADDAADDGQTSSAAELAEGELMVLSGGAPAATGAGLDVAPGPPGRDKLDGFGEVALSITAVDGSVTGWCVLVAASVEQRARGLMEVTDLGGYAGMVFIYDADTDGGFYMRNTPTPLSIAWFGADGHLVSTADMTPCEDIEGCPTYHPGGPYRFALEVPQGDLVGMGVDEGSRLALGGACRTP